MMTITENEILRFKKMENNDTKVKKCYSLSKKNMSAKFEKAAPKCVNNNNNFKLVNMCYIP